jgi:hypothetical protein
MQGRPGNANLPIGIFANRQSGDWRSRAKPVPRYIIGDY